MYLSFFEYLCLQGYRNATDFCKLFIEVQCTENYRSYRSTAVWIFKEHTQVVSTSTKNQNITMTWELPPNQWLSPHMKVTLMLTSFTTNQFSIFLTLLEPYRMYFFVSHFFCSILRFWDTSVLNMVTVYSFSLLYRFTFCKQTTIYAF